MRRKRASRNEGREVMKQIHKHLTDNTAQGKDSYRKEERKLQQNSTREVQSGMRTVTGYERTGDQATGEDTDGAEEWKELNHF